MSEEDDGAPAAAKIGIGFYEQAKKALSERCPFDCEEVVNVSSRVSTLPVGLADFLAKHTISSRKRQKKTAVESSSQHTQTQTRASSNVWLDTEDYFRPVGLNDIELLYDKSSFATQSCFTIPSDEAAQQLPPMEIDVANVSPPPSPDRPTGLEWLLGSSSKILLTSERPSKKRKLLGSDAGLDRLRLVSPSQGHTPPVCHVCCLGDLPDRSNQLLLCDSCKVVVHQRCYGVQDYSLAPWLCSWCKHCRETGTDLFSTPCCLCPKPGGALKPVPAERKSTVSGRFVHLFCCQWMPEVYVEDTRKMEPIINIGGIKDTRKKLVCNICKIKYGACLRCTHGTCRTSFHPICAREARHRMEIWGKIGSEAVELRAFCSKHSDFQDSYTQQSNNCLSIPAARDSSVLKNVPAKLLVNKPHKIKPGHQNGDNSMILASTLDAVSNKQGNSEVSWEQDTSIPISDTRSEPEVNDAQLAGSPATTKESNQKKTIEGGSNGSINPSNSINCVDVLKKLVDRGEVSLGDVASEIDISCDTLAGILVGDRSSVSADLQCKMVKWLCNHSYIGSSQSGHCSAISVGANAATHSTKDGGVDDGDNSTTVSVKLVLPGNNIESMKDSNLVCSLKRIDVHVKDMAMEMGENVHSLIPDAVPKEHENCNGPLYSEGSRCYKDKDDKDKVFSMPSRNDDRGSSIGPSVRPKVEPANGSLSENGQVNAGDESVRPGFTNPKGEHPVSLVDTVSRAGPSLLSLEPASFSYIHPFIQKKLMGLASGALVKQENNVVDSKGYNNTDSSGINDKVFQSPCMDLNHASSALQLEQLVEAKKTGVLDLSPKDEVEGELIYFQNKLIDHAVTSRHYCDDLIFRVIKALPQELDAERRQRWDSVLVNQYMCGIREAKKQGRKERRHKEAQAVLAAATAAAAASSRISSFRKDSQDEVAQEATGLGGRTATHSQMIPRAKETLSRLAVPRVSSAKPPDVFQLRSFVNEHQQLCDICRRSETMLNPIFVCCNCKVAVHFGCYRGVKDHTGPWCCEHCEELLPFRSPRSLPVHAWEKSSFAAQCGLCGVTTGAFRKSADGQWIHAFCAEWLLESTYRRGQPNLVEGMENIMKGRDVCYICSRKIGLCVKCNYGNCQSIFHPYCSRNAGFYMIVRTSGGKVQRKAYCDRHSLEQREKAEAQLHGPEELKSVKQIRVELERVRLLCERIIKREKVKRELVICSHNILASKRDSVAFSVLVRSPFFLPDVSSESATTSLRGHVDDNKSCSEAMQRSEDVTVDSAISANHRVTLPVPMEPDQKTDDSSTSQQLDIRNPHDRPLFSGKQLPHRPASFASWNPSDDEEKRKLRKHTETFQKELVMTSDQASVQNQRLPKGFAYVPIVCLPKEKAAPSEESVEPDG